MSFDSEMDLSTSELEFIQINLQHCREATGLLSRKLGSKQYKICLIQEPWIVKSRIAGLSNNSSYNNYIGSPYNSPRTCILVPRKLNAILLLQFCTRDLTVIQISWEANNIKEDVIIASCYLPIDAEIPPPSNELEAVVEYSRSRKINIIIGCDTNAHHSTWGSADINNRGKCLYEYLVSTNLEILNRGSEPTFVTSRGQSIIDLTLASFNISNRILNWTVSSEISLSDHRYILFKIKTVQSENSRYRNPRRTDIELYKSTLSEGLGSLLIPTELNDREVLDGAVLDMQNIIIASYEQSCPITLTSSKSKTAWWSKGLAKMKNKLGKLFNKAKSSRNANDWLLFKELQRSYKKEARKRQRSQWTKFCNSIESTSVAARLKRMLSKDPNQQLSCLKREDGSYTETLSETHELLLKTHFPGCQLSTLAKWPELPRTPPSREEELEATSVVTKNKIAWAVKQFQPFSSPGRDGVFPALLQWGLEALSTLLERILRACLSLKHVPNAWRDIKVVFIPKPGRVDYTTPKAYRPISLSSVLLKTLERLCDRHIRDAIQITNPLHPNQHAYLPGRSTESALHSVVRRIERSMDNNMSTLGVFIDIEGAFDKASFKSIEAALRKHGVHPMLCTWIGHMLQCRAVSVGDGDSTKGVVIKGCPQGGVLSPLLWNLVVDNLLESLNNNGFTTFGYADDITITLTGKIESTLCDLMQTALNILENWCNRNFLSVNPAKTELILFTRKRKLGFLKMPKLFGTCLELTNQVKYLGIILDSKLNWSSHLKHKIQKASVAFWQCRRTVGRTWGLSPKIVLWLYTAVIRPMLCYGSVVWWPKIKQTTAAKQIEHVQRLACLAVTGSMRTTPTAAMEAILNIPSLDLFVEEDALRSSLRLSTTKMWKENISSKRHTCILEKNVRQTPILSAVRDQIVRSYNFNTPYQVWINGHPNTSPDLSIFTDGSRTDSGSGAGVYCQNPSIRLSISLGVYATIFQCEITGILEAARKVIELQIHGKTIRISSDSRASLLALSHNIVDSGLVAECIAALKLITINNVLELVWVKGHNGNEGNEKADELARQGSEKLPVGPEPVLPLTNSTLKVQIKKLTHEKQLRRWVNLSSCRQTKNIITNPSDKLARYSLQLSRQNLSDLVGIITGHCRLNKHLHTIRKVDSPLCRACNWGEENVIHIICECPALLEFRKSTLGEEWVDATNISSISPAVFLDFFRKLGWLD